MVRCRSENGTGSRRVMYGGAVIAVICAMLPPTVAQAQVWADIACSESPLVAGDGLHCRASEPYKPGGGSRATYRFYTAATTTTAGASFLYLMEGLDEQSWIRFSVALPEQLSQSVPLARGGRNWSAVRLNAGSGYALFTAEDGTNCVGFRKPGPDRGAGHAWAILGIRCAQKGETLSDADVVDAIEAARMKERAR